MIDRPQSITVDDAARYLAVTIRLRGVHGQAIYVDPSSRLVMVHTAVLKEPAGSNAEAVALWQGVVDALATGRR